MKTAAEEVVDRGATMTPNKCVEFQVCLSVTESEAAIWSKDHMHQVVNQLEREIYGIIWNERMWFMEYFIIRLIDFEARWKAFIVHQLQKTVK